MLNLKIHLAALICIYAEGWDSEIDRNMKEYR